jgi:hypothetical protein
MKPRLEVLHVPDCPNLAPMLQRLSQVTDLPVTTREIRSDVEAAAAGMAGSPTLLIDGADPFATGEDCACGLSCRLYRDDQGHIVAAPPVEKLRAAICAAECSIGGTTDGAAEAERAVDGAAEVLSAWRTRALPLDPVEKAVHQAILRSFATTGGPPARSDLDPVTAGSRRSTGEVLAALHEADAIRLGTDDAIVVAYPFSVAPTRHRVRIGPAGEQVEVYAMCAIDALGISAMLNETTRIESVDITTGGPVTVTMTGRHTRWQPAAAVVFVGATGRGPSVDCCCDYLNFFTSTEAAHDWTAEHPHVPGQILTQTEAEDLGARLFRPLLAS